MVTNQGLSCNVDLVFCIEITKKMFCMLSRIKEEVRKIYSLYVDSFRERGKAIGKFRIKIITFGSQMSKKIDTFDFVEIPNNEKKLDTILGSIRANAEVGEYCSGIEALSKAINSDWNREGERRDHVIIVYSSSSTLPVISRDYNIEDKYTIEWERKMEDSAKRLILFTPDAESWTDIATYWEKVIHIPSQAGFGLSPEEFDLLLSPVPTYDY